jgi:hypothetical protein
MCERRVAALPGDRARSHGFEFALGMEIRIALPVK